MSNIKSYKVKTKDCKKLKVKVNRDLCIGAATCITVTPKMFALDDEAKAIVLPTAGQETYEAVLNSAKSCPVAAIILEDESGKQIYP